MDWTELVVTAPLARREDAEAVIVMLMGNAFISGGYYLEDYSDLEETVQEITRSRIIEQALLDKPRDTIKLHLYFSPHENIAAAAEAVRSGLLAAGVEHTLEQGSLRQEDWETAWKQYYHPIEIGRRLAVAPSWEEYQSGRAVLRMDPGMAFGTGTHETTYMCLAWLEEKVAGGEDMLDIGTGSGVLAVAALLLGAKSALGIDIDPLSVQIAEENAARNHVREKFTAKAGDLAAAAAGRYDIITANIVAAAIVRLAPDIPRLLGAEGIFIASGIIADKEPEVSAVLQKAGLAVVERRQQKEWVALLAKKKQGM